MYTTDDAPATPGVPAAQIPEGLRCGKCGSTTLKTSWQQFSDGRKHVRADCSACGKFLRYLKQPGEDFDHRPRRSDAHARETAPPPASSCWAGAVRHSDNVWLVVAVAPTRERALDAVLHYPSSGVDMLTFPVGPAGQET